MNNKTPVKFERQPNDRFNNIRQNISIIKLCGDKIKIKICACPVKREQIKFNNNRNLKIFKNWKRQDIAQKIVKRIPNKSTRRMRALRIEKNKF